MRNTLFCQVEENTNRQPSPPDIGEKNQWSTGDIDFHNPVDSPWVFSRHETAHFVRGAHQLRLSLLPEGREVLILTLDLSCLGVCLELGAQRMRRGLGGPDRKRTVGGLSAIRNGRSLLPEEPWGFREWPSSFFLSTYAVDAVVFVVLVDTVVVDVVVVDVAVVSVVVAICFRLCTGR